MHVNIRFIICTIHHLSLPRIIHNRRLRIKRRERRRAPSRSPTVPVLILRQVESLARENTSLIHVQPRVPLYGSRRAAVGVDVGAVDVAVGGLVAVAGEESRVPPESLGAVALLDNGDAVGC